MTLLRALAISMLFVAPISTEPVGINLSSDAEIKSMLDKWQGRLGLSAWRIGGRIVPAGYFGIAEDGSERVADISYDMEERSAAIRVKRAPRPEMEESVIHELIHLRLAAWQPPETSYEEEGTIDTIVSALLHARLPK